jgi:hypothetical protein
VSIAAGNEPNPPARQTAIVSSGPCALAIGAWTSGIFEGSKVIKLVRVGDADGTRIRQQVRRITR